jgi:hypothetical protein
MITSESAEWVLLSEVYHHVLAQSPSPEFAKMEISTARKNSRLRLRAELREHKAQPHLQVAPGERPPETSPVVTLDYAVPPDTVFCDFDWERSYATRRNPMTRSLFEYVCVVVHRDDALALWPQKIEAVVPQTEGQSTVVEPAAAAPRPLPARPPEVSDKVWAVMCELIALKNENSALYDLLRERQLLDAVKKRIAPGTVELRTLQTAKAALKRLPSCK